MRQVSFATDVMSNEPWCIDTDTAESVIARRNALIGLWAGHALGLKGNELTQYARQILAVDLAEPGDDDITKKVMSDFRSQGMVVSAELVRQKIREKHLTAFQQLSMTD